MQNGRQPKSTSFGWLKRLKVALGRWRTNWRAGSADVPALCIFGPGGAYQWTWPRKSTPDTSEQFPTHAGQTAPTSELLLGPLLRASPQQQLTIAISLLKIAARTISPAETLKLVAEMLSADGHKAATTDAQVQPAYVRNHSHESRTSFRQNWLFEELKTTVAAPRRRTAARRTCRPASRRSRCNQTSQGLLFSPQSGAAA